MTDGFLDLLIVQGRPKLGSLLLLWGAWRGRLGQDPGLQYKRCRSVKVEGPPSLQVHADGELVGGLPVEISLVPAGFPLVVPGPASRKSGS